MDILPCEGAFVRNFPCETPGLNRSSGVSLRIDSLDGSIRKSQDATTLSLTLLGFYNASQLTCTDVQLTEENDLRFRVLGYPVGRLDRIQKLCYSPAVLWRLPESLQVSKWELTYSLDYGHPLQTLAGEFEFSLLNGSQIGCAAARITPDIGTAASAAFTYLPAAIILLIGIASLLRHTEQTRSSVPEQRRRSVSEPRTTFALRDSIRKIVVDVADYVRYLQFIFLPGSLTMNYPGFYQPIVSQLAWSSLLYWSGPADHGFTYPGIQDRIYAINGTYGLEYMVQNLGFPSMLDIMFDALIKPVHCRICDCDYSAGGMADQVWIAAWRNIRYCPCATPRSKSQHCRRHASVLQPPSLGVSGVFPCLRWIPPQLPHLSGGLDDWGSHWLESLHRSLSDETEAEEIRPRIFPAFPSVADLNGVYRSLFSLRIPLIQGLAIGGLQLWGWVQLLLLSGCEVIILAHLVLQRRRKIILSKCAWCAAVRLLTLILSVAFVCPSSKTTRQWIDYFILVLHGVVVIFGFFFISLWHIARFVIKGPDRRIPYNRGLGSSAVPHLNLGELSKSSDKRGELDGKSLEFDPFDSNSHRYSPGFSRRLCRGCESSPYMPNPPTLPEATASYTPDTSTFYRTPRSHNGRVASCQYENLNADSILSDPVSRVGAVRFQLVAAFKRRLRRAVTVTEQVRR